MSLWIRLRLDESPLFRRMQTEGRVARAPLSEAFLEWKNLRLVLLALFSMMMGQGVVWYTANFYAQFFLERVIKVEPRVVNLLIMAALVGSAGLHIFFARLSDRIGRKPIMLFGLALAMISLIPGFQLLTEAVNPASGGGHRARARRCGCSAQGLFAAVRSGRQDEVHLILRHREKHACGCRNPLSQ